jgi:hypothetical protein
MIDARQWIIGRSPDCDIVMSQADYLVDIVAYLETKKFGRLKTWVVVTAHPLTDAAWHPIHRHLSIKANPSLLVHLRRCLGRSGHLALVPRVLQ